MDIAEERKSLIVNPTRTAILVFLVLFQSVTTASGCSLRSRNLCAINRSLEGVVLDFTANHGCDRRIWSPSLCKKRDLYVYLPPGYDPRHKYPVMIWLHGIGADEWEFVARVVQPVDRMMACGKLPPCIIVIPDGTARGRAGLLAVHSSFVNSRLGRYGDYLEIDIWNFVVRNFSVRPERRAHVIAGVSMGGGAAFHHAIKHHDRYGTVFGIFPPLNVRWVDCRGKYFGNFDPCCWGWRTSVWWGHEPIGKFYCLIKIPLGRVVYPLYGRGPDAIRQLSLHNPIEMLDRFNIRPGQLEMHVAYGGQDEFNIDAQVESFLYRAKQKGLKVTVTYDPCGRHDTQTAMRFLEPLVTWLAPRIAPYAPPRAIHAAPDRPE